MVASRPWVAAGAPLLAAAGVGLGALALRLRDPHVAGSWGLCPVQALLGVDCPGCGALRAVNLLTHGDLLAAASSNLLLVAALPLVLVGWVGWLRRSLAPAPRPAGPRRAPAAVSVALVALAVVATVAFTVARNLPAGAWLHS